ncbi:hypothetical protein P3X46_027937 [Hevea brasiliensis]|uniref:EF-hand domain-containing protein n=1 Tax=Hevea brasiliensis TaxID=3981 RepID=A0ABQ9L342_HEVBR|nr:calcium-binding protein CP1 [Hevea brasiliensis]KAJ9154618.1 hypothetical protein P3X46_027937 [Hevea brasiliensis]
MCPSGRSLASNTQTTSDLRAAFDILDADHDGKISRDDLRKFYAGLSSGDPNDDDVIGSMISVADFNKDGFVEYEEFKRVLDDNGKKRSRNNGVMEDVFKVMDKDGDGKLSHEDLKSYMQWAGFDASDDDIKAMMKLGGGDDKDGLSFGDLLKILSIDL